MQDTETGKSSKKDEQVSGEAEGKNEESLRLQIGKKISGFSTWLDQNYRTIDLTNKAIIAASVGVILYYSRLARKYRRVSDIPANEFRRRTKLQGRVTSIVEQETPLTNRIYLNVEHRPFLERKFPFLYFSNSGNEANELLIQVFGVESEPGYTLPCLHERGLTKDGSREVELELLYLDEDKKAAVCHVRHRPPAGIFVKEMLSSKLLDEGSAKFYDDRPGTYANDTVSGIRKLTNELETLYQTQEKAYRKKRGLWKHREFESRDVPQLVANQGFTLLRRLVGRLFASSKSLKK